jgi:hypothetical protein
MEEKKSLKDRGIDWLFNQGIASLLLGMILLQFPSLIASIQSGYQEHADKLDNTVKTISAQHEKDRQFYVELLSSKIERVGDRAEAAVEEATGEVKQP